MTIDGESEVPGGIAQTLRVRGHVLRSDIGVASGGDSAPDPHDYFADEANATYPLAVRLVLHGPLTDAHRRVLETAAAHCPIHKLMTTADVVIKTTATSPDAPRESAAG